MKRLILLLIAMALMFCAVPFVSAAGYASMTGPGTVRAGDTITVNFSAGGGIIGGSGTLSYDPAQLTLLSCSGSLSGSWEFVLDGSKFLFWDDSMSSPINGSATIFTAKFQVNSSLATGTSISVTASNVKLSDGNEETNAGTQTYSAVIAAPLSGDNKLSSLTVSGGAISPAFSPDVTKYTISVPFTVSSLDVTAEANHPNAKVTVSNTQLVAGATTNVTVTVTAENGAVQTYSIQATRAQDPNYVKSSDATLSSLSVDGYALSPVFSADMLNYYVWLPFEASSINITAKANDSKASTAIGEASNLVPGQGNPIPITVTAEDGSQVVYTLTAVRAPAHEDVESYLSGEREPAPTEPATEPATEATEATEATTIPTETEAIPEVIATSDEGDFLWYLGAFVVGAGVGALLLYLAKKRW